MIKVSVLYPRQDGAKFDMKYYLDKHIPMVKQKLGSVCKAVTVEQGLAGGAPETTSACASHASPDSSVPAMNAADPTPRTQPYSNRLPGPDDLAAISAKASERIVTGASIAACITLMVANTQMPWPNA